jgi:predicted transcriptional regulator
MALEQFKLKRPASELQDYQLAVLSNPDTFDLNDFYSNSLLNAVKKYCERQSAQIKVLKKEAAKAKRISKVIKNIKSAQYELETKCSTASSFPSALTELKELADTFSESVLKN